MPQPASIKPVDALRRFIRCWLPVAGGLAAAEAGVRWGIDHLEAMGVSIPPVWQPILGGLCLGVIVVPLLAVTRRRARTRIIDALPDPAVVVDTGGRIVAINDPACRLLGFAPEEVAGCPLAMLVPSFSGASGEIAAALQRADAAEAVIPRRLVTVRHRDGRELAARMSLSADGSGDRRAVIAVITDYSEQQQAERMLRESEARFRTMADRAPIMMWMDSADGVGHGIYYNKAWLDFTGRTFEEELGMSWQASLHPDDHDRHFGPYRAAYAERREFTAIYRLRRHDGEWRWIGDHGVPRFDSDGEFLGYIGVCQDITEEHRARETARRNQTMQSVLNRLLALPTHTATMPMLLEDALDAVLQINWLGLTQRCEIHLLEPSRRAIEFVARRDGAMPTEPVPAGTGVCGCRGCEAAADDVEFHAGVAASAQQKGFPGHYRVPLRHNGQRLGSLLLGTDDDHQPTAETRALLATLAATLAGVIDRKRSVEALRATARAVSTGTGTDFLQRIAATACQVLGMDACLIGRHQREHGTVESLVFCADGRIEGNFAYVVAGTHCEQVVAGTVCRISDTQTQAHGQHSLPHQLGMRSYVGHPLRNATGDVIGLLALMSRDAEQSHSAQVELLPIFAARAAQELERQEQLAYLNLAAHAFETLEGIFITDPTGRIERVNSAMSEITGFSPEELVGNNPRIFKSGRQAPGFYRDLWATLRREGRWQGEIWNRRKNGELYPAWQSITAVRRSDGSTSHYVASLLDISERNAAEARIERLAYYDELTGLANRRLLQSRVEQSLAAALRNGLYGALIFVDLDHFKTINDALGHAVGDALLELVADRLKVHLRAEDTVARLGGDEFVILLPSLHEEGHIAAEQARSVADKIRVTLNDPYQLSGNAYHVSPSIGVTLFPEGIRDADELLRRADTAMYRAKAQGRNCVAFYEPAMQAAVESRLRLQKDLRQAIDGDELFVTFQPQVDPNGRILGAEALVRWAHPERGTVAPSEFIPIAEETGLIVPLGEWVLRSALRQFVHLQSRHPTMDLRLSVNMSARQFVQPDALERITAAARDTGADLHRLTIEFTESIFIDHVPDTITKMMALKELGVSFSIDDFGTGYSSLTYLKRLPIDEVKIDRSFTKDITVDPSDAAIVESILSVARHLKLKVVAEGVETLEQLAFLRSHGCGHFQGYLFATPQRLESFERLLAQPTVHPDSPASVRTLRAG